MIGRGLGRLSQGKANSISHAGACALVVLLAGCSAERRQIGPSPPATPPTGASDSRQKLYQTNRFEQAEGARVFRWAGCDGCHTESSKGAANLSDGRWVHGGAVAEIYQTIAAGAGDMPAYAGRLTPQQLWQLSGYLKTLPQTKPNMRRRNETAQRGEPSGAVWRGALR
jgi:cytochrome c oxidase cbb3-type subunit III